MGRRSRRSVKTGIVLVVAAATIVMTATAAFAFRSGRMTGGGRINTLSGVRVTHGFELYCITRANGTNLPLGPNNLEVNWEGGAHWHLETLTRGACHDEQWTPEPPAANFDAYYGQGFGRLNGVAGAFACWRLTDDGEPGTGDLFSFRVWAAGAQPNPANATTDPAKCPRPDATPVLAFSSRPLRVGNHQAHLLNG